MSKDLTIADGASAGAWIAPRLRGGFGGKVKQLVPNDYDAYTRVFHSPTDERGRPTTWAAVAKALGRTAHARMQWHRLVGVSDPLDRWGSEWQGSGPGLGQMDPPTLVALLEIIATQAKDSEHCFFGLTTTLEGVERAYPEALQLQLPGRDYVVFSGPLSAAGQVGFESGESWVTEIYGDGRREQRLSPSRWLSRAPNLIWPDDHSWYMASDVDLDSTLIGGSRALIDAILASPDLEVWEVGRDDSLEASADRINR